MVIYYIQGPSITDVAPFFRIYDPPPSPYHIWIDKPLGDVVFEDDNQDIFYALGFLRTGWTIAHPDNLLPTPLTHTVLLPFLSCRFRTTKEWNP